jgi:hypothetical protein
MNSVSEEMRFDSNACTLERIDEHHAVLWG